MEQRFIGCQFFSTFKTIWFERNNEILYRLPQLIGVIDNIERNRMKIENCEMVKSKQSRIFDCMYSVLKGKWMEIQKTSYELFKTILSTRVHLIVAKVPI